MPNSKPTFVLSWDAIKNVGFPIFISIILLYAVLHTIPIMTEKVNTLTIEVTQLKVRVEHLEDTINNHFGGGK